MPMKGPNQQSALSLTHTNTPLSHPALGALIQAATKVSLENNPLSNRSRAQRLCIIRLLIENTQSRQVSKDKKVVGLFAMVGGQR